MIEVLTVVARDIRGGIRLFAIHRIGVTMATMSLSIALGIGAGIITVVNSWLFPPVGVSDPQTLRWMNLALEAESGFTGGLTYRDFEAVREQAPDTPIAALLSGVGDILASDGLRREDVALAFVTGDFFTVAGGKPSIGRLLDNDDVRTGFEGVVLSDDAWSRMFNRSPDVLGRTVHVSGRSFVIVGVMQPNFTGPSPIVSPALWLPVAAYTGGDRELLGASYPRVLVRLQPDAVDAKFRTQAADAIAVARLSAARAGTAVRVELRSILDRSGDKRAAPVMPAIWGLICALVLVAIVNLAGFLLTIATSRQREIALRLALGASRPTIFRQLLIEGLVVGMAAAVLGSLAMLAVVPVLDWMIDVPLGVPLRADIRSYVFLFTVAVIAAAAAGIAPIRYASRVSIAADLSGDHARFRLLTGPNRIRSLLVGLQVSVSVVILVLAALWTRGGQRALEADLGFDAAHVLFMRGRPIGGDWSAAEADRYWTSAMQRVRAVDGVVGVSLARSVFGGGFERQKIYHDSGDVEVVAVNRTTTGYFHVMQIRLLGGRVYDESEVKSDAPVAVISETVARKFWGTVPEAVGASMSRLDRTMAHMTIIGVVEDSVPTNLLDLSAPVGTVYRPLPPAQSPDAALFVRVDGNAAVLQNTVERALPVFNAERPPRLKRLEAVVQQQMRLALIPSRIARFGAVSVVVLTVVGLQGLVALAVNQRIKDIAVRVALGASPWAVARYAANIGLKPAMWGLLLGIIGCFAVVRTLRAMLFGVSAFDPFSLLVSCLVLTIAVVAGVASPLIQALHIDPADNLKAT